MKFDLEGRAAVVTGGSKGIGFAIARSLVGAGVNVAICSRDEAEVERAARDLDAHGGGTVIGLRADMRVLDDVRRLVADTASRFGRLDVLINNAGVGVFAPVDEISPEIWSDIIGTNLTGVFHACREAIPHMKQRGEGWIINIGSLAGKNPFAGGAAYNASKFGLLGFSEAMMLDVRHHGIRVSCVMPGSVETHFNGPGSSSPSDWKLQPEDIAEAVMDLLAFDTRALPSRVEIRPSRPPKK